MKWFKQKSNNEFLEIIRNYQAIIHKVCRIYFKSQADRDENFQEILYQLCKSYPTLTDKSKIGSWMYKVAIYTSIVKIRKDSHLSFSDNVQDNRSEGFEENIHTKEEINLLYKAIEKLGEIDKAIILLYLEEKEYSEISEIMGISISNVGVKILRIKEKLKLLMEVNDER